MSPIQNKFATVAVIAVAAYAGHWFGQRSALHAPMGSNPATDAAAQPMVSGPIVYYRDPNGKPFYALTPRKADDGQAYVAVHASEDVSFDMAEVKPELKPGATPTERKIKFYRNPMGLPDTSPTPKKDSMGMDYIAVYDGDEAEGDQIKVSPGKIQRTGVETVAIGRRAITRTLKVPGVVALDERRISVIAPRYDGFVEKVSPVTTGTHVKQGDALVTVFGQDLLDQGARLIIEQGSGSNDDAVLGLPNQKGKRGGAVGASRRLTNMGAPDEFIAQIKRDRRVPDSITIRAPRDGVIFERNFVDGQAFKAGDVAFRIADTSVVWLMADVAEADIDAVRPGQTATVTTRAHPGRTFTGKVALVYPGLTKETRTARVRIELANPDRALLPDMYGEVDIVTGFPDEVVVVPASAIIDSGKRQVVIVDQGDGRFEPHDVTLGRKGNGFTEVLSGVAQGDKVVVNGNFLIDAESNLQAALKGLTAPSDGGAPQ